ncbi:YciI family protein [Tahibacter soli]|jgi:hypothetical protein|uniref:YciI family protein n=1 Tax=Tahibacter soli TaxID=2983605 RepID=A0A9X3YMG4_9GAMM|nr:YciI family protein [Tahibacter soli]MDC8013945.1 YciI family protein [Tahibacter soli]
MKFMLIMNTPYDGYDDYLNWPQKIREANIAFMVAFSRRLAAAGELVATQGLDSPHHARRVRAGADGKPITDGVFPESKEFLAGYWLIDVDSAERAYALAAEASMAPGVPSERMPEFWIEVRQLMACHEDIR